MSHNQFNDASGNSLQLVRQLPDHTFVMSIRSAEGVMCEFKPSPEQFSQLAEMFSALADFGHRVG